MNTFEINNTTRHQRDRLRAFLEDHGGSWERLDEEYWNFTLPQDEVDDFESLLEGLGIDEAQYRMIR